MTTKKSYSVMAFILWIIGGAVLYWYSKDWRLLVGLWLVLTAYKFEQIGNGTNV